MSQPELMSSHTAGRAERRSWAGGLGLLLATIVVPLAAYVAVERSRFAGVPGLALTGGLMYPVFALWLLSRIRRPLVRLPLMYLVIVIAIGVVIACVGVKAWLAVVSLAAALAPVPIVLWFVYRRQWRDAAVCTCTVVAGVAIVAFFLYASFVAMGRMAMSGLRY